MKKNLIKLSAAVIAATLFIGCGSSGSDNKKVEETPTKTPTETPVVDVRNCTFSSAPTSASLSEEGVYKPTITVKDGNGNGLSDMVITPALDENGSITEAGDYNLTVTSPSCDNNTTLTFTVAEYVKVTTPTTTVTKGILPFD